MPTSIRSILVIAFGIFSLNTIQAQEPIKYEVDCVVNSKNGKEILNLYASTDYNKPIEGYFIVTIFDGLLGGSIQNGSFDLISEELFGGDTKFMVGRWVKNGFPVQDLETLTNGINISCAVTFNIQPFIKNEEDGSIGCAVKFGVYTSKNQKDNHNTEYDLKLFYKLIYTNWDKDTEFDFLKPYLKDHSFSIKFNKADYKNNILTIKEPIYNEVKKSFDESKIGNKRFNFSLNHWIVPAGQEVPTFNYYNKYIYLSNRVGFEHKTIMAKEYSLLDTIKTQTPIYYASYSIPLSLQNSEKVNAYKKYNSYSQIMRSTYSLIIIPISYENGYLTMDVIAYYAKLNLNDNISRWSPFKKRMELKIEPGCLNYNREGGSRYIEMPKENWSANFIIGSEKYDIYGYSDYEKFVDEQLFIKLDGISKE